ncbi:MAG: RNA polymerase sigma factor [Capnocytophaga sp.]|nr:RNA polymerase sigma factor [Capnocytophaga sp.]
MDEKELISQLQNPKTQSKAFEILVQQYQRRLYWHIRRMVLSHDDTDDVLQDTFVKVFKNITNFRGESSLFSWLYRIATNQALDFLKKRAAEKHTSIEDIQADRASQLQSDAYYEGDAMQLKFQQAIATLPEKQQLVFNMKYFEEMKYEEISEILDTSVGALKASYHHAVQKIKNFLETN